METARVAESALTGEDEEVEEEEEEGNERRTRRRGLGLHRSVQLHLISSVKQRVVTRLVLWTRRTRLLVG